MAQAPSITFELYSSSFCGACRQTRTVLHRARQLVPAIEVTEHDLAFAPALAEERGIESTPTVIARDASGREILRATGVPTLDHVLVVAARAIDAAEAGTHGALPASRDQMAPLGRSPR